MWGGLFEKELKMLVKRKKLKGLDTYKKTFKEQTSTKKKTNTLPPSGYPELITPVKFLVREFTSSIDETKIIKQYVVISVKRFDDDESPVSCFLQLYQESDKYTGFLKGKSVHFPITALDSVIKELQGVSDVCKTRM